MSVIAVKNVHLKCNLKHIVKLLAKKVNGHFEALNFVAAKNKDTKICYIRLSASLDPIEVVNRINSGTKFVAYIPDHVPNMPLASKSGQIPYMMRRKLNIREEEPPHHVLAFTHNEIMVELQGKYTGLYNLSKKTGHKLLESIARTVFDRLKSIMESNLDAVNGFALSKSYRKLHPHFGDFQLILSTLHRLQDAAGAPRTQIADSELTAVKAQPFVIDNIPYNKVKSACSKYSDRIHKKILEHINTLQTDISETDTDEEIARKKVREELKKLSPYLPLIIQQVISNHFIPQKTPSHRMRVPEEPGFKTNLSGVETRETLMLASPETSTEAEELDMEFVMKINEEFLKDATTTIDRKSPDSERQASPETTLIHEMMKEPYIDSTNIESSESFDPNLLKAYREFCEIIDRAQDKANDIEEKYENATGRYCESDGDVISTTTKPLGVPNVIETNDTFKDSLNKTSLESDTQQMSIAPFIDENPSDTVNEKKTGIKRKKKRSGAPRIKKQIRLFRSYETVTVGTLERADILANVQRAMEETIFKRKTESSSLEVTEEARFESKTEEINKDTPSTAAKLITSATTNEEIEPAAEIRESNELPNETEEEPTNKAPGIKMAVIAENYPITNKSEEYEAIKAIQDAIWIRLEASPDPLPILYIDKFTDGVYYIYCRGLVAMNWLKNLNGVKVDIMNRNVTLKVIDPNLFQTPVKMICKTRGIVDQNKVLELLQHEHPSLRTSEWKLIHALAEEKKSRRVFCMDRMSANYIKSKGFILLFEGVRSFWKVIEDAEYPIDNYSNEKVTESDTSVTEILTVDTSSEIRDESSEMVTRLDVLPKSISDSNLKSNKTVYVIKLARSNTQLPTMVPFQVDETPGGLINEIKMEPMDYTITEIHETSSDISATLDIPFQTPGSLINEIRMEPIDSTITETHENSTDTSTTLDISCQTPGSLINEIKMEPVDSTEISATPDIPCQTPGSLKTEPMDSTITEIHETSTDTSATLDIPFKTPGSLINEIKMKPIYPTITEVYGNSTEIWATLDNPFKAKQECPIDSYNNETIMESDTEQMSTVPFMDEIPSDTVREINTGKKRKKKRSGAPRKHKPQIRLFSLHAPESTMAAQEVGTLERADILANIHKAMEETIFKFKTESLSEDLTNKPPGIKMAVIPENYPTTNKFDVYEAIKAIQGAIWVQLEASPDPLPIFYLDKFIDGIYYIYCLDTAAVKWLKSLNGFTIDIMSKNVTLKVIDPILFETPVKMACTTRGMIDQTKVLELLQHEHPSLRTCEWKLIHALAEEKKSRRILCMDRMSADYIESMGYKLLFGGVKSFWKVIEDADKM